MLENFTLFSGVMFNTEFWSSTASVCLYASTSTLILTLINQVKWCHPVLKQRHQIQLELHILHDSDIVKASSLLLSFPDFANQTNKHWGSPFEMRDSSGFMEASCCVRKVRCGLGQSSFFFELQLHKFPFAWLFPYMLLMYLSRGTKS